MKNSTTQRWICRAHSCGARFDEFPQLAVHIVEQHQYGTALVGVVVPEDLPEDNSLEDEGVIRIDITINIQNLEDK